ncbi:zinc finger protein 354B-like isoform X2 [Achroia grisella]|uniref:zinc finger protein 354B-like isoform X2 n=1 Tax=Achroia grisella TaxID=688607 RepID=UPI0027D303D0|nr:zinc finger protein 354B-like isoform X2 [Achroia grisella]
MDTTMNHGMCRCCASEGTFKNLSNAYQWMGQEEIYSDMLKECFDISLTTAEPGEEGGICEVCITQLRNAANFKKQVQHTEVQFKKCLQDKLFKSDLIKVEATNLDDGDDSDNDNNLSDNFSGNEFDMAIKKEKEDPKPKKRVATRASTSRAKKSKVDDGEPSTKRDQEFIKIEIREVPTKKVALTTDLSDDGKDRNEDYYLIVNNPNDDLDKKVGRKVRGNRNRNTVKSEKVVRSNDDKRKNVDRTVKSKHLCNVKAILENSNATIIRHRSAIGYSCVFCTEQYADAADLKSHSLETYDPVGLRSYITAMAMKKYIIKVDITGLCCKLCQTSINSLENLMEHLQNIHNVIIYTDIENHIVPFKFDTKTLTCAICVNGITFYKFKSLYEHMRVHYRNYVCDVCDEGFINFQQLKNHTPIHESGNFACETCPRVFNSDLKLKAHVRAVHAGKSNPGHKCGYCNEVFKFHHTREKHLREEHGVNITPITCKACDKTFLSRPSYTKHMYVHLMLRPHACNLCDKTFAYTDKLKEHHERVHLGLRLHKCEVCLKTFSARKTLKQHIRIHTNDRRYKCSICGQAFIAKISWRGHMRSKHGEVV